MNMANPGQLGVALGRATTIASISQKTYGPSNVRKQPTYIELYYNSHSKPLAQDCSCCQAQKQQTGEQWTAESQTNVAATSQNNYDTSCSDSELVDEQMTEDIGALDPVQRNPHISLPCLFVIVAGQTTQAVPHAVHFLNRSKGEHRYVPPSQATLHGHFEWISFCFDR